MSAMHNSEECQQKFGHRRGRGPSSFWMHDPDAIFSEIGLKPGESFLDLGCGPGDYAMYAANLVGNEGTVYAVDRWEEMVAGLIATADRQGLENIIGIISDITAPLPLNDRCIDVCFIATVLHIPAVSQAGKSLLGEARRVLKPDGRLAIIECHKQSRPFGPPEQVRLSPEEVEELVLPCGFERTGFTDVGDNYLIQFQPAGHHQEERLS